MTQPRPNFGGFEHEDALSILARADARRLKAFAEPLIPGFNGIVVEENRTGLVMLPMRDTAQGTHFHLGEVLMSEARISDAGAQGYGMRQGRDLEAAMAMAIVDLAMASGHSEAEISTFLSHEKTVQSQSDDETLRRVQATRVNMETF
ncbi:MAG: phosphonate C-P lyase system protein PhnG [Pelagimonas sp.]|uniref:phosphonate C-P lyase system protein PhnG n=1 Tax=Pelagimonas sp. TaxID=2073170 RepID=UPI003D6AA041